MSAAPTTAASPAPALLPVLPWTAPTGTVAEQLVSLAEDVDNAVHDYLHTLEADTAAEADQALALLHQVLPDVLARILQQAELHHRHRGAVAAGPEAETAATLAADPAADAVPGPGIRDADRDAPPPAHLDAAGQSIGGRSPEQSAEERWRELVGRRREAEVPARPAERYGPWEWVRPLADGWARTMWRDLDAVGPQARKVHVLLHHGRPVGWVEAGIHDVPQWAAILHGGPGRPDHFVREPRHHQVALHPTALTAIAALQAAHRDSGPKALPAGAWQHPNPR
ncbi:hypothetical protein [Kitasatospora sp. NPDC050543]|uniref:hypothetical protein n=1 Tax=Kitasatospora sp. NPDC050543 TaxID=3364054 RepID=UPI0037B1F013